MADRVTWLAVRPHFEDHDGGQNHGWHGDLSERAQPAERRDAGEEDHTGDEASDVDPTDVAQPEQDVTDEVADDAAVERVPAGVDVAVVVDEHDEAEGDEHDASDEQEVDVGVRVAGEPRLARSPDDRRSTSSATLATTSKYSHHRHTAMARPHTRASGVAPVSSALDVAAPTATIDSPMAMMMTSPKRSAKCDALLRRHRVDRTTYTPTWSHATAASHHQRWALPPITAPVKSSTSITVATPSMPRMTLRSWVSSPAAIRYTPRWVRRTTA